MIRTERGRVVYERKKHVFGYLDAKRIMIAYGNSGSLVRIGKLVKELFRGSFTKNPVELDEAIEIFGDIVDAGVEFVDGYAAMFMMFKGVKAAVPPEVAGVGDPLRVWAARHLRKQADIMEER